MPRQPYRGLHPTYQAQDSDTQSQSHIRNTTYGSNKESPPNPDGSPAMQARTAGNEKADEWAKMAALNERGSEQLPYEFSSTSLARLKRGITEWKWIEACSWMEPRLSKQCPTRDGRDGLTPSSPSMMEDWTGWTGWTDGKYEVLIM